MTAIKEYSLFCNACSHRFNDSINTVGRLRKIASRHGWSHELLVAKPGEKIVEVDLCPDCTNADYPKSA